MAILFAIVTFAILTGRRTLLAPRSCPAIARFLAVSKYGTAYGMDPTLLAAQGFQESRLIKVCAATWVP
ncbi:MAG: hypothetical protein CM15mP74_36230 [Halieaceae bacterium]|nr:MAG: hypothetical protein CM15mP74_36230 [Halieaceae bacterium]